MKKLTALLLIAALTFTCAFSLSACKEEEEEDLSTKIEEKVVAYTTDLKDSADTLTSTEAVREYLQSWAKAKGISCTVDGSGNVIMTVKSSKAYKEADPTVLVCSYDGQNFQNAIEPMAMALYAVKNNEDTGKLTAIFTAEEKHDYSGVQNLSSKYFPDNAKVFCLNGGSKNMWSVETGGRSSYAFTGKAAYTQVSGDKAFRIRITGLPGGIPDSRISSYPNPIKELGDLLAYFKTNALIFQLAKVSGGSSGTLYPKSASATVVIDEDDVEKFQSRMETAIETFYDHYDDFLEEYPDVSYTYEEVDLPEQVLTQDSLNSFISELYTLIDGVYYKDEDENLISITSIGSVHCKNGRFTISAIANSLTTSNLKDIDQDYETICGLSGFKYKKTGEQEPFAGSAESEFIQAVMTAFDQYADADMELKTCVAATNASYIHALNPKVDIVNVSVNDARVERYTGTLITYLMNQEHEEEE